MLTPWQRYDYECETSTQRHTPDVLLLSLLMVDVVQFKPPLALVYQGSQADVRLADRPLSVYSVHAVQ